MFSNPVRRSLLGLTLLPWAAPTAAARPAAPEGGIDGLEPAAGPDARRRAAEHCLGCFRRYLTALPALTAEMQEWLRAERQQALNHDVDETRLLRFARSRERAILVAREWAEEGAGRARATIECGSLQEEMLAWLHLSHALPHLGAARDTDRIVRNRLVQPNQVPFHKGPDWDSAEAYHMRLDGLARAIRKRILVPFLEQQLTS
jgi:hypothetical protein